MEILERALNLQCHQFVYALRLLKELWENFLQSSYSSSPVEEKYLEETFIKRRHPRRTTIYLCIMI
jgi:hypothetical protein